jgi:hypothetical protein
VRLHSSSQNGGYVVLLVLPLTHVEVSIVILNTATYRADNSAATERGIRVVSSPVCHSVSPGFKSRPGDRTGIVSN